MIGLGVFLLCCADYRIGITGDFKAHANEVVNGMVIPAQMTDLAANRILPNHFTRMFINGEAYHLEKSIETGLIDQVCKPEDLMKESLARAVLLNKCMHPFYHKTKLIARRDIIKKIQEARKLS